MKELASQSPLNTIYLGFGHEELIMNIGLFTTLKIIRENNTILIAQLKYHY